MFTARRAESRPPALPFLFYTMKTGRPPKTKAAPRRTHELCLSEPESDLSAGNTQHKLLYADRQPGASAAPVLWQQDRGGRSGRPVPAGGCEFLAQLLRPS